MAPMKTQFAPAERVTEEELQRQVMAVGHHLLFREILSIVPDVLLILNAQRQVVFANKAALAWAEKDRQELISGLRPGDVWQCRHAGCESGCGTTEFCQTCAAANTVLKSQKGHPAEQECRISRRNGEALDLLIATHSVAVENDLFVAMIARDISDEKRRRALERIFFHDINNTALGFQAFDYFLNNQCCSPDQIENLRELSARLTKELIEEIKSQRDLTDAEHGDLSVHPAPLQSKQLLEEVITGYKNNPIARKRTVAMDTETKDVSFRSDKTLLRRILSNLVKNALEASGPGQTVRVKAEEVKGGIRFSVHNENAMPRHVQLQIFNRSFSTKGAGRGLGTYSVRLLSEKYLKGTVTFESSSAHGTTFAATFPLTLKP